MGVGVRHRQHDRREPGVRGPPRLHRGRRSGQRGVPDRRAEQGVRGPRRDRGGYPAGGRRRLRVPLPQPGGREGTRRAPPGLRAARARRRPSRRTGERRSRGTTTASRSIAIDGGPQAATLFDELAAAAPGDGPVAVLPATGTRPPRRPAGAATGTACGSRRRSRRLPALRRRPLRAGDSSTNPGAGPSTARGGETLPKSISASLARTVWQHVELLGQPAAEALPAGDGSGPLSRVDRPVIDQPCDPWP